MTDLFLKVKIHQEQNLPFVLFCKPNSDRIIGMFQRNDHLYFLNSFDEKGFVFAPFDSPLLPILPVEHSNVMVDKLLNTNYHLKSSKFKSSSTYGKDYFENLVEKAIDDIKSNKFTKVLLSRKEEIVLDNVGLENVLNRIFSSCENAFRYVFFHPKIGIWIGATPEQFLKIKSNTISTVALAGTQLVKGNKNPIWQEKEQKEQQFVTDFIVESLDDFIKEITISTPYSIKAGNLWHIKTDISAKLKSKKMLKSVINALHPTPAVCGLPKEEAKRFILENEGYNREYYSGYLGELNIDLATFKMQQSDLYVNLRCMKLINNKAQLFVGCGILSDSNPESEYLETVNKTTTMRNILK